MIARKNHRLPRRNEQDNELANYLRRDFSCRVIMSGLKPPDSNQAVHFGEVLARR